MIRIVLACLASLLVAQPAQALLPKLTLPIMVQRSTHVVRGDVVEVSSHWIDSPRLIVTDVVFQPRENLAGTLSLTDPVAIRIAGGTVGEMHCQVEHSPTVQVGDDLVLFLSTRTDGNYSITFGEGSTFRVVDGTVVALGGATKALSDFRAAIKAIAQER